MSEPRTITVEQARAAVLESGQLVGLDGPYFLASEDAEWSRLHFAEAPPLAARVVITRRDQAPREVVIRWAEYEAQEQPDPDWNALRAAKPMTIFGSEVERHAYRVVFADVLAPLLTATPTAYVDGPAPWETPAQPTPRDWRAELLGATDVEALDAVVREARAAKVFSPTQEGTDLDRAWKAHRKQLLKAGAEDAWSAPTPPRAVAAPSDHLPPAGANRAARRATSRKKGRRR
ncbi:hypothetical protein [Microbacterium sp. IEGM 1404]|uniref:hypothetical protein n=1 Tax=Microbacterium sp. IEGM 1404 TaxID=3047084 RepID=UPI0024B6DE39|nr:hypothetical protein [Microbacterium sp. IEGM 1404]MDI9889938.1 hypothetical protein [Microbacterium sp. IEGM 1404]